MGTMPAQELLNLWKLEAVTPEMVTGHILQNLVKCQADLTEIKIQQAKLQVTLAQLQANVERLLATAAPPLPVKVARPKVK